MKKRISFIACILISLLLIQQRYVYTETGPRGIYKVTNWDALGYYMYLPGIFIYHDIKKLSWLDEVDRKYGILENSGYQAEKVANGNYVDKYLGGVAIMQMPFFLIAHATARQLGYPTDGFSQPYQYAVVIAALFYCLLGIFLLRKVLLRYFDDVTTAITLVLLCVATNLVQYAAIHGGLSHAYIFLLYVLILHFTIKWHEAPGKVYAALCGLICGFATMCRPTEAIIIFIPLFWNTHTKETAKAKWAVVRQHSSHIWLAAVFGLVGVLPQLIYWKITSDSFLFDVGSKWDFLSPHFRVLFGWEKGWFIYTPVTILFIIGMFFMKRFPFRKSVFVFCLLNIYIIISWSIWRYGASYSCRALVESYPVFALPFAAFVERIRTKKWKWGFYALGIYLVFLNLFQIWQYSTMILHFDDMNRQYYGRIYLNAQPTPIDMSLLDTDEVLREEKGYTKINIVQINDPVDIKFPKYGQGLIFEGTVPGRSNAKERWLKITCSLATTFSWDSYLDMELRSDDSAKHKRVRLFNAISTDGRSNPYAFYMQIPGTFRESQLRVYISSGHDFDGKLSKGSIIELERR